MGTGGEAWADIAARVRGAEGSELERLTLGFDWITRRAIAEARSEIERLRAVEEREAILKAQIKLSVLEHCREIFQRCHTLAAGRVAWEAPGPRGRGAGGAA